MLERRHVLGGAAVTEEIFPGRVASGWGAILTHPRSYRVVHTKFKNRSSIAYPEYYLNVGYKYCNVETE